MKFCITSLLILFICFKSEAQRPYTENQKFEFDSLMVLSIDTLPFYYYLNQPKPNYSIPTNAKWQLLYYKYVG